ncbi:precorrin-2 dehydrogenase [Bacillus mangrovi]|uniref:precorrin-2 dehydrogenase n=1 Tax=Metabacillus mangrovi TaxID=1491830 RepID=A0A7X2V3S8_9BACI|nr:NAD(P)-dependent oxidoreductase [Metabacillus mangrovi]MTH52680.1 precorrin-2 dehydrogenase [Metabacillus mangrovi]
MLPLMLNLEGKPVLIAGGGKIALRRLRLLLAENADITVISPESVPEIRELAETGAIKWIRRKAAAVDLPGYLLIVAATDSDETNRLLARNASPLQLVNNAGDAGEGNTEVPKHEKRGRLTIAVSTGGASPQMAKSICSEIIGRIDRKTVDDLDRLYEERAARKNV